MSPEEQKISEFSDDIKCSLVASNEIGGPSSLIKSLEPAPCTNYKNLKNTQIM